MNTSLHHPTTHHRRHQPPVSTPPSPFLRPRSTPSSPPRNPRDTPPPPPPPRPQSQDGIVALAEEEMSSQPPAPALVPQPPPTPTPTPTPLQPPQQQQQKPKGGYAVELYFDPALENQVLKAWNVLARRQISSQLIEIESRPHITLLSLPPAGGGAALPPLLDPHRLLPTLRSFASRHEPLSLTLSSVGTFSSGNGGASGNGSVLFIAPTPSVALLSLHSQLCEALRKDGVEIGEEFRPDSWVPHCPVAQDVHKSRMAEAFCILRDLKLPVSGYAMDVGLVEFSPAVREVFSFPLGNAPDA